MPFRFLNDLEFTKNKSDLVILISQTFDSKDSLLCEFARQAQFPNYFGINWDAFEECLRDLSWVNQERLIIIHKQLPLSSTGRDLKVYIQILFNTTLYWLADRSHEFIVVFPETLEKKIMALIKAEI